MSKLKIGDYVNKSGYKFRVMGISGTTAELRGSDGQGDTLGEVRFLSPWTNPTTQRKKKR